MNETELNVEYIHWREPYAVFWSNKNYGGTSGRVQPVSNKIVAWPNVLTAPNGTSLMPKSAWIPPHMSVTVFDSNGILAGRLKAGAHPDISNMVKTIPRRIQSLVQWTWDEHKAKCCTGSLGTVPELCGIYWGKGDHQGVCDELMADYCKKTPQNRKCGCYGIPTLATDTMDIRLMKAQPKCWSSNCSTHGYLPSNMINSPCPSTKICIQDFNMPGYNNVLNSSDIIQDCSETNITNVNPAQAPTQTEDDSGSNKDTAIAWIKKNFLMVLMFILVLYIALSRGQQQPAMRISRYDTQ